MWIVHGCCYNHVFQVFAFMSMTFSGTSRRVCGGCGNSTVSRQGASWGMRWDWVKPSRSSAFWLDWATANWEPEGPTTGVRTHTHAYTQTVSRDCVSVWYEYLIRGISTWECSSELLNMFQLSDSSLFYLFIFTADIRENTDTLCVCVGGGWFESENALEWVSAWTLKMNFRFMRWG